VKRHAVAAPYNRTPFKPLFSDCKGSDLQYLSSLPLRLLLILPRQCFRFFPYQASQCRRKAWQLLVIWRLGTLWIIWDLGRRDFKVSQAFLHGETLACKHNPNACRVPSSQTRLERHALIDATVSLQWNRHGVCVRHKPAEVSLRNPVLDSSLNVAGCETMFQRAADVTDVICPILGMMIAKDAIAGRLCAKERISPKKKLKVRIIFL